MLSLACRHPARVLASLLLLLLLLSTAQAQPRPFEQIILPGVVLAGEPATLSVIRDGRPAAGVAVELDSGAHIFTDANGHAHFQVPTDRMILTARLREATATATVLSPVATPPGDRPQLERVPRLLAVGEAATIRGRGFDGYAEANQVLVGSAQTHVLAASPAALVIALPTDAALGAMELRVRSRSKESNPRPVTLVALRIDAPARLVPGEKVRPRAVVKGTQERVQLEIMNGSPEVLRLQGGNEVRVVTSGGEPNTVELKARALKAGAFSLTARIVAAAVGEPDTEYAKLLLDRARRLTDNPQIQERIAWMLVQLDRQPSRSSVITREINRILGSFPMTVPLGKTLEAARDALEGH